MFKFSIAEDGRVLAFPDNNISKALVFESGDWKDFTGKCGVLWLARPVTEAEAMRLTSGVMPA